MKISLICLFALTGCEFDRDGTVDAEVDATASNDFTGEPIGASCTDTDDCREGLLCQSGKCKAGNRSKLDERCLLTAECQDGLFCGWAGFCVEGGTSGRDEQCSSSADCNPALYCKLDGGTAGHCTDIDEDAGDIGSECESTANCLSGLVCSPTNEVCQAGSVLLNPDVFRGVSCSEEEEAEMRFGVRHRLPDDEDVRFYHLPFPNDIRTKDGKVDLSSHPVPGSELTGNDPASRVIDAINEELEGFGLFPGVYFRFTRPIDPESITVEGRDRNLRFIDLKTGSEHPFEHTFVPGRNKYICHNYLYVHPLWSRPLKPNTTYAVVLTDSIEPAEGSAAPEQLDALSLLLSTEEPSGNDAKKAWRAYDPLRDFIAQTSLDKGDIIGATVFTTGDPTAIMNGAREVMRSGDTPQLVGTPVLCEAGVRSPCADPDIEQGEPDQRNCPAQAHDRYYEIHAKIRLPSLQEGEKPYLELEQGGGLVVRNGKPTIRGSDDVCIALTIPKGEDVEMPEGGWPAIIYGHGTGGGLRSGPSLLGAAVSQLGSDPTTRFAMIAIDQSMHGPRKGADQSLDEGPLFFNVNNPKAAKGNVVQGAADNFALVRFAQEFEATLPGAGAVRYDSGQLFYNGHSQGGTTGPLFAPFEPDIRAAAFSGAAGSLVFSFLGKKSPYDSSVGVRLSLQELSVDETHPMLHIFQMYFDAADPLAYGPLMSTQNHKHFLHIYGRNDSFTPDIGQRAYAASTGALLGLPSEEPRDYDRMEDLGMRAALLPLTGNLAVGDERYTAVVVQHFNDPGNSITGEPYDGHFVTYRDRTAIDQLLFFLHSLLLEGVPTVR